MTHDDIESNRLVYGDRITAALVGAEALGALAEALRALTQKFSNTDGYSQTPPIARAADALADVPQVLLHISNSLDAIAEALPSPEQDDD